MGVLKFKPENPMMELSDIDTEDDIRTKIFISIKDNAVPLSGILFYTKDNVVYYDTVFSYIDKTKIIKNFNEYLSANTPLVTELLKELNKDFPSLKMNELVAILSFIINNSIPGLDANKDKILFLRDSNNKIKQELSLKFLNTKIKEVFIKKYIDSFEDYSVFLAGINFKISKTPIDIYKIIKTYKLSEKIPFMMVTKKSSDEPIIKYHSTVDKNTLKSWVYNQKEDLKKPRGLIIKVFSKEKNDYHTINISRSTDNIHMKAGFESNNVKYEDVKDVLLEIEKFIKDLKKYVPEKEKIPLDFNISSFNIQISLKQPVVVKKIAVFLRNKFMTYQSDVLTNSIKFKNISESYSFFLRTDGNQSVLKINQLFSKGDIKKAIREFFDILINVVDAKIIIKEDDTKKGPKKTRKLKDLKALGIFIRSTDCQKLRHIDIYEKGKEPTGDSYILDYKDVQMYCKSRDYPYPGFTNSNAPCCFKKDQRNKEVYLRNTGATVQKIILSDEKILKTNIINTNKILDANRAGIVPYFLQDLFNSDYLRIGVIKNSFLNSVKFLTGKDVVKNLQDALDKDVYKSVLLPNGRILSEEISYDDYANTIKTGKSSGKMKLNFLHNVLEKKLNTGIIVFKINFETDGIDIEIPDIYWDLDDYSDYIFILNIITDKKEGVYEPIVLVNKLKGNFKKTFKKQDDITILIHRVFKQFNIKKLSPLTYEPPHIKKLLKDDVTIKAQIVNAFNKIEYVQTDRGILPVKLTTPSSYVKSSSEFKQLLSFSNQLAFLKEMSKIYDAYKPVAVFKDKNKINAILTQSGILVPVTESSNKALSLQIINNKLPVYMSNLIKKGTQVEDPVYNYTTVLKYRKELYEYFRFLLSSILNSEKPLKDEIKKMMNEDAPFNMRIKYVEKIIDKIFSRFIKTTRKDLLVTEIPSVRELCHLLESCSQNSFCKETKKGCMLYVNEDYYKYILNAITIEVFNKSDIFKGNIQIEFLDKNNFIPRNDEIILMTKEEIKKII